MYKISGGMYKKVVMMVSLREGKNWMAKNLGRGEKLYHFRIFCDVHVLCIILIETRVLLCFEKIQIRKGESFP